jgi:hypothetical protein
MFDIAGFEGVAPGAQLIGLKIANDARGGISVTGSMQRALEYAARFAAQRGLPLVLNLSFGVGNEREGRAEIDSIVDAFLLAHPTVMLTISAGNDGPGLSTVGFPGSADLALSVGALEPGAFTRAPQPGAPPPDRMGWWSSRGGDLGKPDLVAPGEAFSTVPRWNLGNEIKVGTSMAAPQVAGLVACLRSAMTQEHQVVSAADLSQALRATAVPLPGWNVPDQGAGVPKIDAAYRWLVAGHQGSRYVVRTANGSPAAMRRNGFAGAGDTVQAFTVTHADGLRAAQFRLSSDAPWLSTTSIMTSQVRRTTIAVGYRASRLTAPGVYVGTVTARNPTDSTAGPLFTLVNTVVIPYDLSARALADTARVIGPARVLRYFLRVPVAGTTLRLTVALRDSDDEALVQLYDPHGRPASADPDSLVDIGYGKTSREVVEIPAEAMEAGVYELDVFNPGVDRTTATVRAELAPVSLAARDDGVLEVSNAGTVTVSLVARTALIGAERRLMVEGGGIPAESVTVVLPPWATRAELLVDMAREQWDRFTDFGLTAFDSAGQQIHNTPLNYARGRQAFDIPPRLVGHPVVFELLPAFASGNAARPWQASLRVRLYRGSSAVIDSTTLDIVAGGRATLPLVTPPALLLPDGFASLLQWRLSPVVGGGPDAVGFQPVRQP